MNQQTYDCLCERTNEIHCSLTPALKSWGCRFLTTPFDETPKTEKEKAKLFSAVYREAKYKGVLECPHYNSLFIDEVLDRIETPIK